MQSPHVAISRRRRRGPVVPGRRPDATVTHRSSDPVTPATTSSGPEAMTAPGRLRWVAWTIVLGLAALQAWRARFVMTPDGVSYLDLSDAVVTGRFAHLVSAYWRPLYPTLIGVVRVLARPNPYWE